MSGYYYKPLERVFLNLSGGTVTGNTIFTEGVSSNRLSGNTIFSAGTDLELIIRGLVDSSTHTFVQPGSNIITGGTAGLPIVSLSDNVELNSITASSLSGDTIYSGNTNIESVIRNLVDSSTHTFVQDGINTFTGGTSELPSVNIVSSPSFENIYFSGTAIGGNASLLSISADTIYSASTSISEIFATKGELDITRVQPGLNINTGGTPNFPVINLNDNISVDSINSSTLSADTVYIGGEEFYDKYTTAVTLNNNTLFFNRTDELSAYTIDLSSLVVSGATDDTYVTGGTFIKSTSTLSLDRNDGVVVNITGITDYYTTAATLSNNILYFDTIEQLSAYTVDLSSLVDDTNFYTTGATIVGNTVYYDRNDQLSAYTLDLSSFSTDNFYSTGATYDKAEGELTIERNDGNSFVATGITDYYTTASTIVGNTVYFDRIDQLSAFTLDLSSIAPTGGTDYYVTGGTFDSPASTLILDRNDGISVNITGLTDYYTTAVTLSNNILYFDRIDQLSAYTVDLSILAPTGGTDSYTTAATLVGDVVYYDRTDQASAYTLSLSGFSTTDIYSTGATYDKLSGELTIERNDGNSFVATGITDYYTTASTIVGNTVYFDRIDQSSAYTLDLSAFAPTGGTDYYVTGGTFIKSASTLSLNRNDGFGVNITGITDLYTTAATLSDNVLYFDRIGQLSAYTIDLSSLAPTGDTTDNFTTASTLVGSTVYFDRNDQLSAYTLDLSSLVVSGASDTYLTGSTIENYNTYLNRNDGNSVIVSGTTTVFSGTEPDFNIYSGNTWIRTSDYNMFSYDIVRESWIGTNTNRITGVRNRNRNNSIFLRYEDGTPYNVNPYFFYSDFILTDVVASDSNLATWYAVLLTGTTTSDIIYSLPISGVGRVHDAGLDIDFYSGTSLYLYMSGSSVGYPRIDVYFRNK